MMMYGLLHDLFYKCCCHSHYFFI